MFFYGFEENRHFILITNSIENIHILQTIFK